MDIFGLPLWAILAALPAFVFFLVLSKSQEDSIPIINKFAADATHKKAHATYLANARALLRDGLKKYNGPIRILTPLGSRVVLPASYASWVKANTNTTLSHSAIVEHEYLTWVPGFEGNKVIHDADHVVIDVTRTKLTNNADHLDSMYNCLVEALDETLKTDPGWHEVALAQTTLNLLSRIGAAVFVGPVLSHDPEWLELTRTYTINLFTGVRNLRAWPLWLRPIVHWFLRDCVACRSQLKVARRKVQAEFARRKACQELAVSKGNVPEAYNDALTWVSKLRETEGHTIDPASAQLAFALASLHTTTQLLQQAITDIAVHPELIEPLRDEISASLEQGGGWTTKALAQMQLLDSCIKETQRLKPGMLINLERQVLKDVVMPNGVVLPRGTNIAVDTSAMWDQAVHEMPEVYDGHRFLRLRQSLPEAAKENTGLSGSRAQLASSSEEHFAFGLGKSICPGRSLVATETKLVLAYLLMGWDMRLKKGTETSVLEYGFEMLSNPQTVIEVRKRG